ncbi:MAG: tau 95 subunit of transcription factor TFIIIC [Candelina mexicana]|nr:MAG: tau 95 subunit of transcription factor TFIIIC [Candelina mexicana]
MDQINNGNIDGFDVLSRHLSRTQSKVHVGTATPWLTIPGRAIVSVEHPCIIKNIDKGLQTMGDDSDIQKASRLVETGDRHQSLGLYLRPEDAMSKPIWSRNVKTNNVLIKVTVPKRTGRKRKRGSTEPYLDDVEAPKHAPGLGTSEMDDPNHAAKRIDSVSKKAAHLLQSLRDNVAKYKVEPVATIEQTHRFRDASIKKFKLDPSKGIELNGEIIPPPSFTHIYTPINYGYHQNPAVKTAVGSTGGLVTGNTQSPVIIHTELLSWNAKTIPSTPNPGLIPFEELDRPLQLVVERLRELLDERPLWTRRAFANVLADQKFGNLVRQGFQYVGYMFRSGPWNNSIIKFGVDPRTDPKYRFYQTLMFQLKKKEPRTAQRRRGDHQVKFRRPSKGKKKDLRSHQFNGRDVVLDDGKTWQVCDISDPLLNQLLHTDNIRSQCDIEGDGWYHNGTWAKAKTIMKAKILLIAEGKTPSDADFVSVMNLPDIIDDVTREQAILNKKEVSMQEVRWASGVRIVMKKPAPRMEPDVDNTVDPGAKLDQNSKNEGIVPDEGTLGTPVDARVAEAMLELENAKHVKHPTQAGNQDDPSFGAFEDSDQEDNDDEDPSEEDENDTDDEDREENEDDEEVEDNEAEQGDEEIEIFD